MPKLIDLSGRRFGRLLVLGRAGTSADGQSTWRCSCDCGTEKVVRGKSLRDHSAESCGCRRAELLGAGMRLAHGHARRTSESVEHRSWAGAKNRCTNARDKQYPDYGGRGIVMCETWLQSFEEFLKDMGPRPTGCSLDRVDNNGPYAPWNCRWATPVQQANNRRRRRDARVTR